MNSCLDDITMAASKKKKKNQNNQLHFQENPFKAFVLSKNPQKANMQFAKIAAVLSFTAAAVAAPAALEVRTGTVQPNACRVQGHYSTINSNCPGDSQFYCQNSGILAIAVQCNQVLNGVFIGDVIDVNVGDIDVDLLTIILKAVKLF